MQMAPVWLIILGIIETERQVFNVRGYVRRGGCRSMEGASRQRTRYNQEPVRR